VRALAASLLVAVPIVAAAGAARGQDEPSVEEARALFEEGSALAAGRRFAEAADAFQRSLALVERAATLWNLAACLRELGRHVEAIGALERYLEIADPDAEREGIDSAGRMLAASRSRAGEITLHVEPPDAEVTLDGLALEGGGTRSATVDPGAHAIRISAAGRAPRLLELTVGPGERIQRAIDLEPIVVTTSLVLRSSEAGATLLLDGEEIGRGTARVELGPGAHEIDIRAEPIGREEPGPRRGLSPALFWTTIAVALAGLATGLSIALIEPDRPRVDGGSTGTVLRPPIARIVHVH
jgi:tetratricopeptide (TPR) repeat protein